MNFQHIHNKAFRAEWLKLRHSGITWLLLGSALFIPLINTVVGLLREVEEGGSSTNVWDIIIESNFVMFASFFFPMFVVLMVTRLVYVEHRSDTWKLLETQPIPKLAIYWAKWEVAVLISLFTLLGLLAFTLLSGTVLMIFRKDYALDQFSPDWASALSALGRYWVSSLSIIAIQYFLCLLIRSFAWPLGAGLIAIITGTIFAGFGVLSWFPHAAPSYTSKSYEGSMTGGFLLHHEVMGLLWAALFLWLGYQFFVRKGFARAFVLPVRRGLVTAGLIGAFAVLAWWVNKPQALGRYQRTVIAGTITSESKIQSVALLQAPANDTLLLIPVQAGRFHAVIPQHLDLAVHTLRAGTQSTQVYMGARDSTYLDWEIKDKMSVVKATGTRVAENSFLQNMDPFRSWALTENAYQYDPKEYAARIMNEWEKRLVNINKFKTVDNIRPADDFLEVQRKLLAVQFLNLADHYYPQVHAIYFPNDKLEWPKSLDKLRQLVTVDDSSLVGYSAYRNYVTEYFRAKSHRNDSLFFHYLNEEVKTPLVKDYLLYEAMQANLTRIRDTSRRTLLLNQVLPSFTNARLKDDLAQASLRLASLHAGRKAYNFSAEALNGRKITLNDLAGRYIVVDVWATWCGPCKKENPIFDELAEQHTSERLAFVSLSVDEDADQWRMKASGRSRKVLQLRAPAGDEEFTRSYAITTIPRFLLIDPKGNIVNANLPRPSDPEFEAVLQKEIVLAGGRQ